jgi:hypothetical protein
MNTVAAARTASTAPTSSVSAVSFTPLSSAACPCWSCSRTPPQWCAACRRLWSAGGGLVFGRGTEDATTWRINGPGRGRVESAQTGRAGFASAGIILCGSNPTRGAVCQRRPLNLRNSFIFAPIWAISFKGRHGRGGPPACSDH